MSSIMRRFLFIYCLFVYNRVKYICVCICNYNYLIQIVQNIKIWIQIYFLNRAVEIQIGIRMNPSSLHR